MRNKITTLTAIGLLAVSGQAMAAFTMGLKGGYSSTKEDGATLSGGFASIFAGYEFRLTKQLSIVPEIAFTSANPHKANVGFQGKNASNVRAGINSITLAVMPTVRLGDVRIYALVGTDHQKTTIGVNSNDPFRDYRKPSKWVVTYGIGAGYNIPGSGYVFGLEARKAGTVTYIGATATYEF